jgi:hypothetical protein
MTDKERLEIIKFLRNSEKTVAPGMQPSELISRKDVDWLINRVEELEQELELEKSTNKDFEAHLLKQVESANELREENEQLKEDINTLENQYVHGLKVQNERYKQALENITISPIPLEIDDAVNIARQALEGDDD